MPKKILFLSLLDFKEKSIQVIRKTPEAYRDKGWQVHYCVIRDNSVTGNYFYESEINPDNLKINRIYMPLKRLYDNTRFKPFKFLLGRLRVYLSILLLAKEGRKILRNNPDIKFIYGYEGPGVVAARILKIISDTNGKYFIHRFQGTFLMKHLKERNYFRIIADWELFLPLTFNADLIIMTNDGTQGDKAIKKVNKSNLDKLKFWINGTDLPQEISHQDTPNSFILLSVSRLQNWKRVDRILHIIKCIKDANTIPNLKYYMVGEGPEKKNLMNLIDNLGLSSIVEVIGAVSHDKLSDFYRSADAFISTYDLSNVGNPLLEGIRYHLPIFTLNNGDTSTWISNFQNGFIYNLEPEVPYDQIAADIAKLYSDELLRKKIIEGVKDLENRKLWTWKERFDTEVNAVDTLK